jgi:hypothetical protein
MLSELSDEQLLAVAGNGATLTERTADEAAELDDWLSTTTDTFQNTDEEHA